MNRVGINLLPKCAWVPEDHLLPHIRVCDNQYNILSLKMQIYQIEIDVPFRVTSHRRMRTLIIQFSQRRHQRPDPHFNSAQLYIYNYLWIKIDIRKMWNQCTHIAQLGIHYMRTTKHPQERRDVAKNATEELNKDKKCCFMELRSQATKL